MISKKKRLENILYFEKKFEEIKKLKIFNFFISFYFYLFKNDEKDVLIKQ